MQINTKKIPKSQLELTIEVGIQEMEPYLDKAALVISQEMKLDGFRPGKAPRKIIESRVGKPQLWEEAAKQGLADFLKKAISERKIDFLGQPQVSVVKLAPDNPFVFKAVVAVMPEVDLGDYRKVKVKKPKVSSPKAEDVNNLVKNLQQMRAKYITVARGAKYGDHVEIDFKAYLKNTPLEGGESKNHPFVLGKGQFVPGFEEQLRGMKAGEAKEFKVKFPREYFKENLAGRLIRFKVKMNLVQKMELPRLDNTFAQSLGKRFKSLADLKVKLKGNLKEEVKLEAQEKYELAVLDKVCQQAKVEIPLVLIKSEKERMLRELEKDVTTRGAKFEDYLKSIKKTQKELKQGWTKQAEKRIKTSLVLLKIAQREKIKVSEQEIEAEINKVLKNYSNIREAKKYFGTSAHRDYIRGVIRNRKVIKILCK